MTLLAKKLEDEILLLPREDRAELVNKILQSLNIPTQTEIVRLWAKESEKRIKDYDEGKIEAVDGEKVFKEIRERLEK